MVKYDHNAAYQRVQETDTYLDTIAESEQTIDVKSVANLLDEIENENLYRILLTVEVGAVKMADRIVREMMGL